jgi:hypothetical protein
MQASWPHAGITVKRTCSAKTASVAGSAVASSHWMLKAWQILLSSRMELLRLLQLLLAEAACHAGMRQETQQSLRDRPPAAKTSWRVSNK